jgi:hypothetical protein
MVKLSLGKTIAHDETGRPWYDTKDGISDAAKTLQGFNRLVSERYDAGYRRNERMNEFYVLGRYFFDTCGNCGKLQGNIPKVTVPDIPGVLTRDEFRVYTGETNSFSIAIGGGGDVPLPGLLCAHCKQEWSDTNFFDTVVYHGVETHSLAGFVGETLLMATSVYQKRNDAVYRTQSDVLIRNEKYKERGWMGLKEGISDNHLIEAGDVLWLNVWRFFHAACNRDHLLQAEELKFRQVFVKAGFSMVSMMDLPNEYCDCEFCAPWFSVITEFGTIKVGWRKRVVSIDWSLLALRGSRRKISSLFVGEDVTKGDDYIHAWGWEKAEDYLARIHAFLLA